MSTERDTTRIVRSWLEDGVTVLPDRVLDSVLDQLPATHQRRPRWTARRIAEMNSYAKLAIAAAAVVVVAVVGMKFFPATNEPGAGSPTPSATATATPRPTGVARLPEGAVDAGTYLMGRVPTFLVTVPAGWTSLDGMDLRKHLEEPGEVQFDTYTKDIRVYADACQSDGTEQAIGATADDLVAALVAQENSEVSEPVDVTIAGLPGVRLEISKSPGVDITTCSIGSLQIWKDRDNGGGGYLAGVGYDCCATATVYVVDMPAGRLAFVRGASNGTAADVAELDAIIASIRLE